MLELGLDFLWRSSSPDDGGFRCCIVLVAERCGLDLAVVEGAGRQWKQTRTGDGGVGEGGGRWCHERAEPWGKAEGRRACFARWTFCKMLVPKAGPFCHGAEHLLLNRTSSERALAISF